MEITPKSQVGQIDAYVNQVQQNKKVEGPENQEQADKPAVKTDTVAISDTAKRIQETAKAGQILISKEAYDQVTERVTVNQLEPIKVKGKQQPLIVYELIDKV